MLLPGPGDPRVTDRRVMLDAAVGVDAFCWPTTEIELAFGAGLRTGVAFCPPPVKIRFVVLFTAVAALVVAL